MHVVLVSDVYMLNSLGDRMPPCGTPVLNWCCVDVLLLNVRMVCGISVWCRLFVSVCMLTMSNVLLISG